ncbi:MAG: hypothetical protein A3A28_03680 [Candidatus Sungbacteria bacterium RIFCSPLOWO2_01_FULL_47_32]|uniref:DUF420 domain-containing protein n=1 Tax=Candidatus Sungbacteria bacterium RIFCSPHIGHO2_01_FULL_47_32 TaxID=1802264 RepID=A0A1G2K266_9BACT|nr:MAG: hypothetical protein UX72_C0010G0028 [Parcubacteria group bacterium GW2011_GWA2_47_10]OGZ93496.1 MAG: hypothetical protein A2633_06430 [Candidatus Sungbacteria bacterium RIFCSPHIGHO2_01_FULL_47_32]OGZ97951.1 MAG: hypothetical protein A3D57_05000 [Candidatus Sungbacteria bacterium RIFCSPHIGHO2_02_FULL_46_12]OHA04395.1 MAG: hypothetical protein A3A28_03680 [Candidatus Sungbacteria bacterium RIFCSPLOWO2_01_FULL_47_32]
MNGIPWYSTFTLGTELLVTLGVFYIIYSAYRKNVFPFALTAFVLSYEILFNISYMVYRTFSHQESASHVDSSFHIAVAIFHGIFSLLMFISLVVFMAIAWKKYRAGINFFREHSTLTKVFLVSWLIAVLSGALFYYEAYFSPEEIQVRQEMAS